MEITSAFSLPPGFGFHPTDVELVSHYLKRKILGLKIDCEVIPEVDIYKFEPWDLPAKCQVPTRDSKWHFFTSRDRKYPNGSRSNRATEAGYWKSTGKDRNIRSHNQVIGTKKTLVFHEGRPPCGKRTDWIMHEYYIDETKCKAAPGKKDIFVLCRVTKRNDENVSPMTEEIHTCPKPPKEVAASAVQEEQSSSFENVEDFEEWFSELYDPDFCAIPAIVELKSEPKQDFGSLALKQEPVDFPPSFSEGLHLFQSEEEDIYSILQDDHDLNSGVLGEFNIGTLDAAASPQFDFAFMPDDFAPPIYTAGGYIDNFSSSLLEIDSKFAAFDPTASTQPNDDSDSGIQIRKPRARPTEIPRYRIKLQVHKMESKNGGTVNQTLKFVDQDHHLDLSDGIQCPAGIGVEEKHIPGECSSVPLSRLSNSEPKRSSDSNVDQNSLSCRTASSRILMHQAPTLRERSVAGPLDEGAFSGAHPDESSCVRGPTSGLRVFLRRCSSAGLNCFLLGACAMGTAAMILYFVLRDLRRFLGSFSAVGL